MTPRRRAGKPLALYVNGRRAEFMVELRRIAGAPEPVGWRLEIRPRERAAVEVDAWVVRSDEAQAEQILWWILRRQC